MPVYHPLQPVINSTANGTITAYDIGANSNLFGSAEEFLNVLDSSFGKGVYSYTVPAGMSNVSLIISGAGGGGGGFNIFAGQPGNPGRIVQGNLNVSPGDVIDIYVGGGGKGGRSNVKNTGGGEGGEYPGTTVFDSINLVGTGTYVKAGDQPEMPPWHNEHAIWTSALPFDVNTSVYFPESTYYEFRGTAYVTTSAQLSVNNNVIININQGENEEYGGNRPYHKALAYITQGYHDVQMHTSASNGPDEPPGVSFQIYYTGYSGGKGGDASSTGTTGAGGGGGAASTVSLNGNRIIVAGGGGGGGGASKQGSAYISNNFVSSGTIKGGDAVEPDRTVFNVALPSNYSNGYNVIVDSKRNFPELSPKLTFSDTVATFGLQPYGSWKGSLGIPGNKTNWSFLHNNTVPYTAEMWFKTSDITTAQQLIYTNGNPDPGVGGLWFGINDDAGGGITNQTVPPIFDSLSLIGTGGITKAGNNGEMSDFYNTHSVWVSALPFYSNTSVFFPDDTYYRFSAIGYVGINAQIKVDDVTVLEENRGESSETHDDGKPLVKDIFLTAGYHKIEIISSATTIPVNFSVSREAGDEDRITLNGPNTFTFSNYSTGTFTKEIYPDVDYELTTYGSGGGGQALTIRNGKNDLNGGTVIGLDDRKPGGDGDYNDIMIGVNRGRFIYRATTGKFYYRLSTDDLLDEPQGITLVVDYKDPPTSTVNLYFYDGSGGWKGYYTKRNVWRQDLWNHMAFVFDNNDSNNPKLFINGQDTLLRQKIQSPWSGYSNVAPRTALSIAAGFKGNIADVRITKDKVYTSNFTPSTDILPLVTNTYLLTCCGDSPILTDKAGNYNLATVSSIIYSYKDFPYDKYLDYDSVTGATDWRYNRNLTSNVPSLIYNFDRLKYQVNKAGNDWGDPPDQGEDTLLFQYSNNGTTDWITLDTVYPDDLKYNTWVTRSVVVPEDATITSGVYFRFTSAGLIHGDRKTTRDCWAVSSVIASLSDDFGGAGGGGAGQLGGDSGITGIKGNYNGYDGQDLLPSGFTDPIGAYGGDGASNKNDSSGNGQDGFYIIGTPLNRPANTGYKTVFGNDYKTHNWTRAVAKKEPTLFFEKIWNGGNIVPELFAYTGVEYLPGLLAYYVEPDAKRRTIKDSTWRADPAPATFIGNTKAAKFPDTEFPCIYIDGASTKDGAVVSHTANKLKLVKNPASSFTIEAMIYWNGQGSNSHDPYGGIIVNKDSEYEICVMKDGTIAFAIDWGVGRDSNLDGGGWIITDVKVQLKTLTHIALVIDKTEGILYINGDEKWRASVRGYLNKANTLRYYDIDRQSRDDGNSLYIGARLKSSGYWKTDYVENTVTRTATDVVTVDYTLSNFLRDNPSLSAAAVNTVLPLYTSASGLNRQPDTGGLAYWAGQVQSGLTGTALQKAFNGGAQSTYGDNTVVATGSRPSGFLYNSPTGTFIDKPGFTTIIETPLINTIYSPVRTWVSDPTYYQVFNGYIGAVRIWDYARTAGQIKDHVFSLADGGGYYKLKPVVKYDIKFSDFAGKTASFPLYQHYKFYYKGNAGTDEKTTITPGLKIDEYLPYYPQGSWVSVDVAVPTSADPNGSAIAFDTIGLADRINYKIVGSKHERTNFLYRSGLWNANNDWGVFNLSNTVTITTGGMYNLDMELYSYQGGSFSINNTAVLTVGTSDPLLNGEYYNIGSHEDLEGKIYSTQIELDPGTYDIRIFANNYMSNTGGWIANSMTTFNELSIGTVGGFTGTTQSNKSTYGRAGYLNGLVSISNANGITLTVDKWSSDSYEVYGKDSSIPGYVKQVNIYNFDPVNYGGSGYDANATVYMSGNASAYGVVNTSTGRIESIVLSDRGSGYRADPSVRVAPPAPISIFANNQGWSNVTNCIYVTNANKRFQKGDIVLYYVPQGNTVIPGMQTGYVTNNARDPYGNIATKYLKYIVTSNSTAIVLSNSPNGRPDPITSSNTTTTEIHYLQGVNAVAVGVFTSVYNIANASVLFKGGILNQGNYYDNAGFRYGRDYPKVGAKVSVDRLDPDNVIVEIWSSTNGTPFSSYGKKVSTFKVPALNKAYIKPTPFNESNDFHEPPAVAAKLTRIPLWDPTGAGNPHGFYEVFRYYFPVYPIRKINGKDYYVIAYDEQSQYNKHIAYYMSRFPNNAIFSIDTTTVEGLANINNITGYEHFLTDSSNLELLVREDLLLQYYPIGLPTGYVRNKKLLSKTGLENTAPGRYKKMKGLPIVRYSTRFNFIRDPATSKRISGKVRVYYNYEKRIIYATWHYDGEISSPLNEAQVMLTRFDLWPPSSMNQMNNIGNGTSFLNNITPVDSLKPFRLDGGFTDSGQNPVKILDLAPNTEVLYEQFGAGHFQYKIPATYAEDKIYIEGSGAGGGAGGPEPKRYFGYQGYPGVVVGGYVNVIPGDTITMHIGGGGKSGLTTSTLVNKMNKRPIGTVGGFNGSANTNKGTFGETGFLNGKVSLDYKKGLTFVTDMWSADAIESIPVSNNRTINYVTIYNSGSGYDANSTINFTGKDSSKAIGIVNTFSGKIESVKVLDNGVRTTTSPLAAGSITFNLDPPVAISIKANTQGWSNTTDVIYVKNANTRFQPNDRLFYSVPAGNTTIRGLTPNSYYYVSFANTTALALSTTLGGANVDITSNLRATNKFNIIANTQGFSNTTDAIYISNANTFLAVNDRLFYSVPAGNTTIRGLTANIYYYVSFANSSAIKLSTSFGGPSVDITSNLQRNNSVPVKARVNSGFSNTLSIFWYADANTYLSVNDRLFYNVPKTTVAKKTVEGTKIDGLIANSYYYVSFVNTTAFAVSDTLGGYTVDILSTNVTSTETHYFIGDNCNEIHYLTTDNSNEIHTIVGDTAQCNVYYIPEYTIAPASKIFDSNNVVQGRYVGDAYFATGNKKSIIGAEVKLNKTNALFNFYHDTDGDPFKLDPVKGQIPIASVSIPIDVVNTNPHVGAGGFSTYNLTGGMGSKGTVRSNKWVNQGTAKVALKLDDVLRPQGSFTGFYALYKPSSYWYANIGEDAFTDRRVPFDYFVIVNGKIVYKSHGVENNPYYWWRNAMMWIDSGSPQQYWWQTRFLFDPQFAANDMYRPGKERKVVSVPTNDQYRDLILVSFDLEINADEYFSTNGGGGGGAGTIVFKNTSNNIPQEFSTLYEKRGQYANANVFRDKLLFAAAGGGGGGGAGYIQPGQPDSSTTRFNPNPLLPTAYVEDSKGGDGQPRNTKGGGAGGGGGGYKGGFGGIIIEKDQGGFSGQEGLSRAINQRGIPRVIIGGTLSSLVYGNDPNYDANTFLGKNFGTVKKASLALGGDYENKKSSNNGMDGYVIISKPISGNLSYYVTAFDSKGNVLTGANGQNEGELEIAVTPIRYIPNIAPFPKNWNVAKYGDTIATFGYTGPSIATTSAYTRALVSKNPIDLTDHFSITYMANMGTQNDWGQIPEAGEGIFLQYSSNVATTSGGIVKYSTVWTTLDQITVGSIAANTWVTRTIEIPAAAKSASNTFLRFIQNRSGGSMGSRDTWAVTNIVANNVPIYHRPPTLGEETGKIPVPSNLIHVEFLNRMVDYMAMFPFEGSNIDKKTLVKMSSADIPSDSDNSGSITLDNDKE